MNFGCMYVCISFFYLDVWNIGAANSMLDLCVRTNSIPFDWTCYWLLYWVWVCQNFTECRSTWRLPTLTRICNSFGMNEIWLESNILAINYRESESQNAWNLCFHFVRNRIYREGNMWVIFVLLCYCDAKFFCAERMCVICMSNEYFIQVVNEHYT